MNGMPGKSFHEAKVVSIHKKGGSSKLDNDRPISVLQTFYKIMAALIKHRLSEGLQYCTAGS